MGQPIVVVEKPSLANPGLVRFETNRALTGMGHERYRPSVEVRGDRPPDELARRLLAHGGIGSVHINGSVITVALEEGATTEGLREIIETLYIHYPATTDEPVAPDAITDGEKPTTEAEQVEQVVEAAPAAPDPEHEPAVPSAVVEAEERPGAGAVSDPPAAPSADAMAEADEVTDADVQGVEGTAATLDQRPVDSSPSEPPADDADDAAPPVPAPPAR